jgi:hypothetical protein
MSYECSFAPEFWLAEGEPYDRADLALNSKGQPVSVYSAIILALQDASTRSALIELCGLGEDSQLPYDDTIAEELLLRAQSVNTCSNLSSPVRVWLDDDGWVDVAVYEEDRS